MIYSLFFITCLVSAYFGFRYFKLIRFLGSVPKAKIRSAHQGYVEIIGRAKPIVAVPQYAPDTDIRCVWFEAEYVEDGGDANQLIHDCSKESFLVDDGTGFCRIDPLEISIETKSYRSHSSGNSSRTPGLLSVKWIAVNQKVHVYGDFDTLYFDYDKNKKDMVMKKISALKGNRKSLSQYDTNDDGIIDGTEWQAALDAINREVDNRLDEDQRERKDKAQIHVMRPPADKSHPYLVSSRSQLAVIQRYKWYLSGCLLIFATFGTGIIEADFIHWLESEFFR